MIEIVVIWPDCLVFICRICFWMNLECKLLSCMWKLQRGFEVCLEVWWKVVIGPSIESSCLSKQLNLIKSFRIFSNIVKLICCCDLPCSGNSVFLHRQAGLWSRFHRLHLWLPGKRRHRHLANVRKGGIPQQPLHSFLGPCPHYPWSHIWDISNNNIYPHHVYLIMISFQSKLQFNTYRVGKSGKT